jgi:tetraacyldisaccharide 4'-kinase
MREPHFWHPRPDEISVIPRLLAPAAYLWGAAGRLRRYYVTPERAAVPIICVGNISAGGTGKTPLALTLAERLIKSGEAVHFLTRGYGGREHGPLRVDPARDTAVNVGDEPLLLAAVAPTWVSADRAEGAAAAARAGARLIIMDDGFQNPSLHKDISLLVVDASAGLGNGRLIPAGPLRERVADALARTGAIVIVGRGHAADGLAARARNRALPVFRAILRAAPAPEFDGLPVLAFAGIGRPEKFYATLRELHADILATENFPDHHMFTEADAQNLLVRAREIGATLVTTEKDRVRLLHAPEGSARARLRNALRTVAVRALIDDLSAFETLIRDAVAAARRPARR